MNVSKANIDSEDVIIVISYSGMNDSVVEMIEQFKLRGTKIISFTSFHQNKIAQVSDYNLYYDVVSKTIVKYNRSEGFFSNLALLIDLFTMSLSNYMVERKED
jgi:RpiR family glv operon transcriptional regulator